MESSASGRRTYKDALFKFIFGNRDHKDFSLDLYNAVNHSDYTDPDNLEIVTLEQVLYIKMNNDAAYLIFNDLSLYEQSTWNPNMTYRFLEYVTAEYECYIEAAHFNKYSCWNTAGL